jgi:hypothetical protein
VNNFEFVFSLFGVLFGFVLVEVLSGFVRTIKARKLSPDAKERKVSLGWLTPLLALFVLFDVSSYWANLWDIRDRVPVGFDTIFGLLLITGVYYLAASLVFPDDAERWPHLDEWFWLQRRYVLGGILAVNLIWIPLWKILGPGGVGLVEALVQVPYFIFVLVAMIAKRQWLVAGALGSLSLVYFSLGVASAVAHIASA